MRPVTLETTSGASDPSSSALPRCSPPAPSAPRFSWTPRPWVSQACSRGKWPAQLMVWNFREAHLCCGLFERHSQCLRAALCCSMSPRGLGRHRNDSAWPAQARAVTAGNQEEDPLCAPFAALSLLSDDSWLWRLRIWWASPPEQT